MQVIVLCAQLTILLKTLSRICIALTIINYVVFIDPLIFKTFGSFQD